MPAYVSRQPTAQRVVSTPVVGTLVLDVDTTTFYVGDNVTPGGVALESDLVSHGASLYYLASGLYWPTTQSNGTNTSNGLGNGNLHVVPWFVPRAVTLTRMVGEVTSAGDATSTVRIGIYADNGHGYPDVLRFDSGSMVLADAVTTQGSTTLTSASAFFSSAVDAGRALSGSGIPGGTTIASVTDATTIVMSQAATATASGVAITLARGLNGNSATVQEFGVAVTLTTGLYWIGSVVQGVTATQPTVRVGGIVPYTLGFSNVPGTNATATNYAQVSVTGALPAHFTSTVTADGANTPRLFVKVA